MYGAIETSVWINQCLIITSDLEKDQYYVVTVYVKFKQDLIFSYFLYNVSMASMVQKLDSSIFSWENKIKNNFDFHCETSTIS